MTVERVSAERTECQHRINQRAMQERQEGEKRQVILTAVSTHSTQQERVVYAISLFHSRFSSDISTMHLHLQ